jgi:hypothetical protein
VWATQIRKLHQCRGYAGRFWSAPKLDITEQIVEATLKVRKKVEHRYSMNVVLSTTGQCLPDLGLGVSKLPECPVLNSHYASFYKRSFVQRSFHRFIAKCDSFIDTQIGIVLSLEHI